MPVFLHRIALTVLFLVITGVVQHSFAQVVIKGTVYNMYKTRPLEAVSVVSTSGKGTTTDSNGNYILMVNEKDSISFSYLGRFTIKYPVSAISSAATFDIALHVKPTELNEVHVTPKDYRTDSLRNRQDYAKVFDFKKPGISLTSPNSGGLGVGLDLDELINVFRFKRNRRMIAFQRRLVEEEEDKYIDHRFNRSIVKKITGLGGDKLDSFMVRYRPSYEFTETTTDYEFYDYIKLAYKDYRGIKTPLRNRKGELKKE